MKARLPAYVQECLVVSGFDTLDTIASMDDDFDNFIDQIQRFVQDNMPPNGLYANPCSLKCVFPPGHKVCIRNFVKEVKSLVESKKRKLENTERDIKAKSSTKSSMLSRNEPQRKRKRYQEANQEVDIPRDIQSDSSCEETVTSITTQVRNSVIRWIKSQQDDLCKLRETKSFSIIVTRIPKERDCFRVLIRCEPCGTKIALHQKNLNNYQPYLISNWTRHVKECKMLFVNDNMKQSTLMQYLSKNSSSSESYSDHGGCVKESVTPNKDTTETSMYLNGYNNRHVRIFMRVCVYVCKCIHKHIGTCMYDYMYVRMYVCMYA